MNSKLFDKMSCIYRFDLNVGSRFSSLTYGRLDICVKNFYKPHKIKLCRYNQFGLKCILLHLKFLL